MINTKKNVEKQYENDENLATRISFHSKYSTNSQGLAPWLFSHYAFLSEKRPSKILELGCGNGEQWKNFIDNLPLSTSLLLSDLSESMVETVKQKYSGYNNVSFRRINIEEIPFPENTFDFIIANYMLYHLPDIDKALSEVKRVLKKGGKFHAATNGNGGMRSFLRDAFKKSDPNFDFFKEPLTFSLQNGGNILKKHFKHVELHLYEDSLNVTNISDLMLWLESTLSVASYSKAHLDKLQNHFEKVMKKEGRIFIPKETGLFIAYD